MTNAMHANVKHFVFGAGVVVLMLVLFWYCFVLYFCEAADRSLIIIMYSWSFQISYITRSVYLCSILLKIMREKTNKYVTGKSNYRKTILLFVPLYKSSQDKHS